MRHADLGEMQAFADPIPTRYTRLLRGVNPGDRHLRVSWVSPRLRVDILASKTVALKKSVNAASTGRMTEPRILVSEGPPFPSSTDGTFPQKKTVWFVFHGASVPLTSHFG